MKYQDCAEAAGVDDGPDYPAGDPSCLAEANINPTTGLATDYLNHFIEAIMLLEMISSAPEFRDEFLAWQPVSYREHFANSQFKTRNTAISAYERADPCARAHLDILTGAMTSMLESARVALRGDLPPASVGKIAGDTAVHLKPLIARAGAVINGKVPVGDANAPQASVDELLMKA